MPPKPQIFAFLGSDDARVKEEALLLARQLTPPENADFGLEIISGRADYAEHAASILRDTIAGLQTLPFLGGDKTVWLQGASFLGDDQTGKAQSTLDAVDRLLAVLEAGLAPGVHFILSATAIDKRRTFYKRLQKLGQVATFDLPDPSSSNWEAQVSDLVEERATRHRMKFAPKALHYFLMLTGENTRQIDSELEKLALYTLGQSSVSVADVRAVVSESRSGVIFEIGDAIGERDLPRSIDLIDHQMRRGENPIGLLLAAIVPKVRGLLLARDIAEKYGIRPQGNPKFAYKGYLEKVARLPKSATAHLPRKKDGGINAYPIYLAAFQCDKFSAEELEAGLHACLEANLRLVSTQMEPRTVLCHLVTTLLQPEPAPRKATASA